ncbi:hypothetical protein [Empedobacter falsenii]|uniref:hypothetical protein n=1 Tax=Empedobacter falsenii TaxID=343874 RepID=UPI001623BE2B|nr:hypothetical protein [Empedobacter falsenii]
MKSKKSISKFNYYSMFVDQFKDQLTIVLMLNLVLFFIANHWSYFVPEEFLFVSHKDIFGLFREQFVLNEFFEVLAYTFLCALFIHFGTYKMNKIWIFRLNALLLIIVSTYFWTIPSSQSAEIVLQKGHPYFIAAIIGQILLYLIVGIEFLGSIKNKRKQPKINHS